jgi:hypothetical protein
VSTRTATPARRAAVIDVVLYRLRSWNLANAAKKPLESLSSAK